MPHFISKLIRKWLKLPHRMCDTCLNQFQNFTLEGECLCDKCYKAKYLKKTSRYLP